MYSLDVDVGTTWMMRLDCSRDGIHRYNFIKLAFFLERSCKRFLDRCNMVLLLMQTNSCWHPWGSWGSLLHCSVWRLWWQHRPWGRIHLHRRRLKSDVNTYCKSVILCQFLSPNRICCEGDIALLCCVSQHVCMYVFTSAYMLDFFLKTIARMFSNLCMHLRHDKRTKPINLQVNRLNIY